MIQTLLATIRTHTNRNFDSVSAHLPLINAALLVIGNLAFVAATVTAHTNPADGYEVDILAATPPLFWVGVGVALFAALWVITFADDLVSWIFAVGLAALAGLSVPALPLIRGYYFYGRADPLNHLGWARELLQGDATFFGDLYPAAHVFASLISTLGGVTIEQAMLLVVFLLTVSFVAFTTLTVWTVLPDRTAISIALVSALLFLPLNHVGFAPLFKTYALASFYFAFVMYLLVKHLTSSEHDPTLPGRLSATDVGFFFGGAALVFYHPQVAANVIVFLGAIALSQIVARRKFPRTFLATSKPVYGQLVVLVVIFFAWNLQHSALFDLSRGIYDSIYGMLFGTEQAGAIVDQRAESAEKAGTDIVSLFVRIFLVPAVYAVVAGLVVVERAFGLLERQDRDADVAVDVFAIGGIVTALFFLLHFVGDISGYFFRHVGFGMILVTVVAALGFHRLVSSVSDLAPHPRRTVKMAGIVVVALALALSMAAFFPSPYISLPTSHVSEQQYAGHATAFEYTVDGAALASPRIGPQRFYDARGADLDNRRNWGVTAAEMRSGLREVRRHDYPTRDFYYLFLTEADRKREIVAYGGFRYGPEAFDSVPTQEGVSRVYSNGEVDVYQVLYSTPEPTGPNE